MATNGSDANPGTLTQPFATLDHADGVAAAGDTVYVRGGVYTINPRLQLYATGTVSAWIVFQAYPGENAILECNQTGAGKTCVTLRGQYLEFNGFEIRNSQKTGITVWETAHIRILSNTVHHAQLSGIRTDSNTPGLVSDILIRG
ncbi:MAG: hypothetical protein GY845_37230, partial [Planctomycetes bacterium]|nr:hypothetical protein [Planctomycetota bacterium]